LLAAVHSANLFGVEGRVVTVETMVTGGLPSYCVVGLPDTAGRESRERVRAALVSNELCWPPTRITVNLAPAAVRKSGSGFELAIAVCLLVAGDDVPGAALRRTGVLGELGLDGVVRPVPGVLALVHALARAGIRRVVVPLPNAAEAALVDRVEVLPARTIRELRDCLLGEARWPEVPPAKERDPDDAEPVDLREVRGMHVARTALLVAAAGGHHLLLTGEPGAGKTMLARRLPTIMAPLDHAAALEVTRIHSVTGLHTSGCLVERPLLRAPHHSASVQSLVGGGTAERIRPGEITLASRGVLFLDEVAEFAPSALDALRQPLEERVVRVCRAGVTVELPADCVLVACCNPCPCGRADAQCRCSDQIKDRYRRRLSAPFLDRFDLRLRVGAPAADEPPGPASSESLARVMVAVERQQHRLSGTRWRRNAHIAARALGELCALPGAARLRFLDVCRDLRLSGRGAACVQRTARTLADLDDKAHVGEEHVEMAASLREDVP
jgi:magnesium chelatase family protein